MRNYLITAFLILKIVPSNATDFLDISLSEAQVLASEQKKNIFLYFTAKWCGHCKVMERTALSSDTISQELKDNYIALKIDGDSWVGEKLDREFEIFREYPTLLIVDATKSVLRRHVGKMSTEELMNFLSIEDSINESFKNEPAINAPDVTAIATKTSSRFTTEYGVLAGVVRSTLTRSDFEGRVGYEAGVFLSMEGRRLLIRPGALLVSKGGKIGDQVLRLNYLKIPVDVGLTFYKGALFGLPGGFRLIASPYLAYLLNKDDYENFDYGARTGIGAYIGESSNLEMLVLSETGFERVVSDGEGGRNNSVSVCILLTF